MISSFEERRVYRRTTSLCEFWFVMYIGNLQFLLHFILYDTLESPIIWLIMILACVCTSLYLNQIGRLEGSAVVKLRMGLLDCMWCSHPIPILILSAFTHSKSFNFIGCLGCFHLQVALNVPKHTFLLLLHVCFILSNICSSQPGRI